MITQDIFFTGDGHKQQQKYFYRYKTYKRYMRTSKDESLSYRCIHVGVGWAEQKTQFANS